MDAKILEALKRSIEHWERLATGTSHYNEGLGVQDCALCMLFFENYCDGCPIIEKTGFPRCRETPYTKAEANYRVSGKHTDKFKQLAAEELKFLKSLLPNEKDKAKETEVLSEE